MYRNIAFDLGGVVVDFAPHDFLLENFCSAPIEQKVYDITFGSKEWQQLDAGLITRAQGDAIMLEKGRQQGCAFEVQAVLDSWMRSLRPRHRTLELIRRLKKMGYHVYFLSNIPEDALDFLRHKEFWTLFEGGIASCDVKINKPDSRIYQALLTDYHLKPSETIFIDDHTENVQAAYNLGITAIHYKGAGRLYKSLNTCGIPIRERLLW